MLAKNLTKILGLSLLVAVGVMAVSASAAQAKWLLLKGGVSVLEAKFTGKVLLSELLVLGGVQIHCPGGTVSATLTLLNEHKVLSGTGTATWTGCTVLKTGTNCTVHSVGAKAGEIVAKGSGTGAMTGEEVYADLENKEFTEILIEGALCSANETDELVNGKVRLDIDEPLKDQVVHLTKILDKGLFFGESSATLHGEALDPKLPEVRDAWVLAHLEEETGATTAVHLVGL